MRWRERGIFSSPIPIIGYRPMSSGRWLRSSWAEGWARFRELETLSLKAVDPAEYGNRTGGGIVLAEGNRQFMRENGVVIYLQASVSALIDRLEAYPKAEQRPTLTGKPVREEVGEVLAQREALYRDAAHHIVDATASPDRVVEQIMSMLCSATAPR